MLIVAEQTCEDDGKLIKLMPPAEPAETNTAAAYLLMSIPKGRMQLTPGGIRGVWAQDRWGNITSHADDGSASAGRGGDDPITQSKPISVALFAHPEDLQAGRVSQDQIAELIWIMANISEAWSPGSNDLPAQWIGRACPGQRSKIASAQARGQRDRALAGTPSHGPHQNARHLCGGPRLPNPTHGWRHPAHRNGNCSP